MKHTILILTLVLFASCEYEPQKRTIKIIPIGYDCEFKGEMCNDDKCIGYNRTLNANVEFVYEIREGYRGKADIWCDRMDFGKKVPNDSFSLKVMENGKVIYHKDGARHNLGF